MSDADPFDRLRQLSEPGAILDPDLLARLLEALPDAIIVVDEKGIIKLVNTQCELTFGYHRHEMLGQAVEMLLPMPLRDTHVDHRRKFFMDPRVRPMGVDLKLLGHHRNGSDFAIEINLSPIVTPQGMYAAAVIRKARDVS